MRLQSLDLSGFKSFAKKTTLQFPSPITAIVGPNGAGKSNIAEAVRWVLGEQSMKSLRGKRGEDLVFHGSASLPRMGKASVNLHFDNHDGGISLDFETVAIGRKIFRDGTNEYALNGSPVRLKDVVEFIAQMGLGDTKHNIIGQGEVDRFLSAGPRERREFLEEALGLRLPQLKKREAERKLAQTLENARQSEALLREIRPHLKFLKTQAVRAEKRETVRKELEAVSRAYITLERKAIAGETERLEREAAPARARLEALERERRELKREIDAPERDGRTAVELNARADELTALDGRRIELERELGRIEGRLEALPEESRAGRTVALKTLEARLRPILQELDRSLQVEELGELRQRIRATLGKIESLLTELQGRAPAGDASQLTEKRTRLQEELGALHRAVAKGRADLAERLETLKQAQANLRERFETLREREEEASRLRVLLERHEFEREKLDLRRQELQRTSEESGFSADQLDRGEPPSSSLEPHELRKKMEKLKVRLEEIGGIDPAVLKEYRDTASRHDFLERELADLTTAARDLQTLIAEFERRIEHDFQKGFRRVNEEFHRYFRIIFGGGRGTLIRAPLSPSASVESREAEAADRTESEEGETDYGIDIAVDLPRKRIKGLAMLSGGERALVSIALLFAIVAVNPPPFLVLDETDASLDEANSAKYAAILQELAKRTQLILITHNRETMKRAGVLYGVTMGDDGISKLLSLKLEEAESYGNR